MVSVAERYSLYVFALVAAVLVVLFAGVLVIDRMADEADRFAYLVLAYGLLISLLIWFLAPRYWTAVLRWRTTSFRERR